MGCNPVEELIDFTGDMVEKSIDIGVDIIQGVGDLFQELLDIPDLEDLQDALDQNSGVLINQSSNIKKLPVVYGTRKVGGVRTFVGVPESDSTKLHIVLALCEGEIEAIDEVYIDDRPSTETDISPLVTIYKYTGTYTQCAHTELLSAFSNVNATECLKGVAAVHVVLTANKDVFSSFPRITCVIRGRKLYDVRTDTTAYSANPALAVYDYLTDSVYGKGLLAADIGAQSFIDAANYCDTTMEESIGSGVNIPYFECNSYLDTANTLAENLRSLLVGFRAHLPFVGGKYELVIEKDETSVFTFDESNIIGGWSFGGTSKRLTLNTVKVVFVNPEKNWQSDMATSQSLAYLAEDNDIELLKEINLPTETNAYRAAAIAATYLKKSRQGISASFTADMQALKTQVGDVVQITHPTPGWTAKKFRIVKMRILSGSRNIAVSVLEHEPTVYDRAIPVGLPTPPDTNLPDPFSVGMLSGLTAVSGTDQLILGSDGSVLTRVKLSWTDPGSPFVQRYEIQYKLPAETAWTNATPQIGQSTVAYVLGVADGKTYNIRIRYVNTLGIASPWASVDHTVVGKTAAPPDVDTFLAGQQPDGTRELSWTLDNPPLDLAGFRIRYKTGTGGTWATSTDLHTNLLLASPYETNQLAKGTYTFLIKAVDTTGNESVNPKVVETELGDPRIANSIHYEDARAQGWPGPKTDCWLDQGHLLSTDSKTWADFATDGDTWADWTSWARAPNNPITYQHSTIDIGAAATYKIIAAATGSGTITYEEQHSDDNVTYTSWAAVTGAEVTARYQRVRVNVDNGSALATITEFTINLSAKPLEQFVEDLDTSTLTGANRIAAGHVKLPLTSSFSLVKAVSVTLQNVGAGWSIELISKSDVTNGPEIKIYNSSNTLADATIDAVIKGV